MITDEQIIYAFRDYIEIIDIDNKHMHEYVRMREREISPKKDIKKVYLDTNHWIWLRDVEKGDPKSSSHVKLYELCHKAVQNSNVVFPISSALFIEFNRQMHEESRKATAVVADRLSRHVALKSHRSIQLEETRSFIAECSASDVEVDLDIDVWTVPLNVNDVIGMASLLGRNNITKKAFPGAPRKMQIMVAENLFKVKLSDMLKESIPDNDTSDYEISAKLNSRLNREQKDMSQKEMEDIELLEGMEEYACALIAISYAKKYRGKIPPIIAEPSFSELRKTMDIMFYACKGKDGDKARRSLRMIDTSSKLYASYRRDRAKGFDKNDGIDILHASMAIPYCDAFLSEAKLAEKIKQKNSEVLKFYPGCQVSGAVDDSISILEDIIR